MGQLIPYAKDVAVAVLQNKKFFNGFEHAVVSILMNLIDLCEPSQCAGIERTGVFDYTGTPPGRGLMTAGLCNRAEMWYQ
jgi:hypothetical protein